MLHLKKRQRIAGMAVFYTLTAACMIVIFLLSNQPSEESSALSDGVLDKILTYLHLELTSHFVRKSAHALEFAGLYFLIYMSFGFTFRKPAPFSAFFACILYAATDEIHQYFVDGRACQLRDVFVDSLGALAALAVCTLIYALFCKIQKSKTKETSLCP